MSSLLILRDFKKMMLVRETRETTTRVQGIQSFTWTTEDHISVKFAGSKGRGRSQATAARAGVCFSKNNKNLLVRD